MISIRRRSIDHAALRAMFAAKHFLRRINNPLPFLTANDTLASIALLYRSFQE